MIPERLVYREGFVTPDEERQLLRALETKDLRYPVTFRTLKRG